MAMDLLGYNFLTITASPYGNYWQESCKMATIELSSNNQLQKLKHLRESEVKTSIKALFENCKSSSSYKVSVEMKHWIDGIVLDIIIRIIAGKCYTLQDSSDFQEHVTNFLRKRYTSNGEDINCKGRASVGATGG